MNILPSYEFCQRCEHFITDNIEFEDCALRPIPKIRYQDVDSEEVIHPCSEWIWKRRSKEELEAIIDIVRKSYTVEL